MMYIHDKNGRRKMTTEEVAQRKATAEISKQFRIDNASIAEIRKLESQVSPRQLREAIKRIEESLSLTPSDVTKTEIEIGKKRKKLKGGK